MEAVALFLITTVLAQALKTTVYKKWGVIGVQVSVFVLALLGAGVWYAALNHEAVMTALLEGVKVFTYAIAFYEVILKNIDIGGWKVLTTKDLD